MARVAVLGEPSRVRGFALVGAHLCPASDREAARTAWAALGPDVAVVVLTADAARWLADTVDPAVTGGRIPFTVVMPE